MVGLRPFERGEQLPRLGLTHDVDGRNPPVLDVVPELVVGQATHAFSVTRSP